MVEALAVGCLAGVRVRAGVGECVAVGRAPAEEAALDGGLGGHGGAHPGLDAVALALAHAAVEAHHEVVGVGAGVDGAADLGNPQLDAVVDEHRERQAELVAVEGAGGLADHHGVEASVRVRRSPGGGRPRAGASTGATGTDRCRRTRDDLTTAGSMTAGSGELPVPGRRGVLLVLGTHPAVEGEPHRLRGYGFGRLSAAVLRLGPRFDGAAEDAEENPGQRGAQLRHRLAGEKNHPLGFTVGAAHKARPATSWAIVFAVLCSSARRTRESGSSGLSAATA